MPQPQEALRSLILSAFASGELRRFIGDGPDGAARIHSLPGEGVPPIELAHAVVELVERQGLADLDFFRRLVEVRPYHAIEISQVARLWRVDADALPGARVQPPQTVQPPGGGYDRAWYVGRPEVERDAWNRLNQPGAPLVVVGPRGIGKTVFVQRAVDSACTAEDVVITVDLGTLSDSELEDADALFRELCAVIAEELGLDDGLIDEEFDGTASRKRKLVNLMSKHFLPAVRGRLVLIVDRAEEVAGRPAQDDLFSALRDLASRGLRREPWNRLRLAVLISSIRVLDHHDPHSSPLFNLTPPIRLGDLHPAQVQALAATHGLDAAEVPTLMNLVGGHPYLLRLAMYRAATTRQQLGNVIADPLTRNLDLFDDYLAYYNRHLQEEPALVEALRHTLAGRVVDREAAHRLWSAGLLADDLDNPRMRYPLFDGYFRQRHPA